MTAPALFSRDTTRGVLGGPAARVKYGSVLCRQIGRVDDILDPDGNAVKRTERLPFPSGEVGLSGLSQGEFPIQMLPGADLLLTLLDAGQARPDEFLRGQLAFAYRSRRAQGAHLSGIRLFHRTFLQSALRLQANAFDASLIAAAPPLPSSWPLRRNPDPPGHRAKPFGRPGSRPRRWGTESRVTSGRRRPVTCP